MSDTSWQTSGHQNQKLFLDNALKSGRVAHAYLFCGPSQIGKRTLALEFAEKIMGVAGSAQAAASKMNPDLIMLDGGAAKIEQVRELISALSLAPYQYSKKVAVIDNFEKIGPEAANSILKTLEEPNASSVLILIAQNRKNILSTIASRCQVLSFNINMETGRIGKLMQAKADNGYAAALSAEAALFTAIRQIPKIQRLARIKELSDLESAELATTFENWLDLVQADFLAGKPELYPNLQLLIESLQGLRQNLNKKFILQKLFLNLV